MTRCLVSIQYDGDKHVARCPLDAGHEGVHWDGGDFQWPNYRAAVVGREAS